MASVAIYFMEFTSRNLMKKVKKWGRRDEMISKDKKGGGRRKKYYENKAYKLHQKLIIKKALVMLLFSTPSYC